MPQSFKPSWLNLFPGSPWPPFSIGWFANFHRFLIHKGLLSSKRFTTIFVYTWWQRLTSRVLGRDWKSLFVANPGSFSEFFCRDWIEKGCPPFLSRFWQRSKAAWKLSRKQMWCQKKIQGLKGIFWHHPFISWPPKYPAECFFSISL